MVGTIIGSIQTVSAYVWMILILIVAVFAIADGDKVVEAYEYCNLHGLWKAEA